MRLIDADKVIELALENKTIVVEEKELLSENKREIVLRNLFEDICDFLNKQPTVNAIPIPENATNGDMIKAMFPNEPDFEYDFFRDWWNAPYKG